MSKDVVVMAIARPEHRLLSCSIAVRCVPYNQDGPARLAWLALAYARWSASYALVNTVYGFHVKHIKTTVSNRAAVKRNFVGKIRRYNYYGGWNEGNQREGQAFWNH